MKSKFKYLITAAVFGLALTSCGFPNIFETKLSSLTLTDATTKTYCVGDSYLDYAQLTIKGQYSDGTIKYFELEEVTPSLTLNGTSYNIHSPFEDAGIYSFRVSKDGVKSAALKLTVLAEPVYVSSIEVSGAHSLAANKTTNLSITVDPSDYTVDLNVESSDTSVATVTKLNKTTFKVTGVSAGDTDIVFSAKDSESTTLSVSHAISVTENYATSISVVSGSNYVAKESSINIELAVNPTDFSVDVAGTSDDTSVATVTKVNNTHFKINGVSVGTTSITFSVPSSATTYATVTHQVTVTNMQKTVIAQTYNNYIKHSTYNLSACPVSGSPKLLVVPVWFTDSSNYISTAKKESVRSDIEKAYFGTTSDTGWQSVASFYNQESSGELTLTGTVSEWWSCGMSANDPSLKNDGTGSPTTRQLVRDAVTWYFGHHSDSMSSYDTDNDGFLDAVMLIYAAPDHQAAGESQNNMWAYCYWVQDTKTTANPIANVFFWASYDFMYDSNNCLDRTGKSYSNGDCSHSTIDTHTFIHEMGHVFGLEDYYDYASVTNPAGGFSMQDWNVGGHDAYSLMAFGWADPYIPTTSCEITIQDFQSSRDVILLTPSWNSYNSPFDEYLLLELYTPTGLNKFDSDYKYKDSYVRGPTVAGIRLWHVDARLVNGYGNFTVNANTSSGVNHALNNTSDYNERPCDAGYSYQKYNILQLIRNSTSATYTTNKDIVGTDLFKQGSSFDMSTFSAQFAYGGAKLDSGTTLGWSFTVNSITQSATSYSATITLTRV